MRIAYILILFWLFSLNISAQQKSGKQKKGPKKVSFSEFYTSNNICPDSACTPYLYYQVYEWLGTRYKYAGDTKKGIDCSGFVSRMYEEAYCTTLLGGSKDIWKTVRPLEKNELIEGDLVFFKIRKGQISHIGIYLGKNKFAHAAVKTGVIVSDLDEPYYKKYFFKGGRIEGL
jgi:lipoprotein Spr